MTVYNMGQPDRLIRVVSAAVIFAATWGLIELQVLWEWVTEWGWVFGIILLATAVWGTCPAYRLFSLRTNEQPE